MDPKDEDEGKIYNLAYLDGRRWEMDLVSCQVSVGTDEDKRAWVNESGLNTK